MVKKNNIIGNKVLIISSADKRHMAMISPYIEYLNNNNIPFDLIRTSRYSASMNEKPNVYEFGWQQSPNTNKLKKIVPYLKFRKYAKSMMIKENYSFVIVWNENTAFLLSGILKKRFKNRFCINIRDTYNHIPLFSSVVNSVCKKACFVTYPSFEHPEKFPIDDFKNYLVLINRDNRILDFCDKKSSLTKDKIRITYLGFYHSAPETFKRMVNVFKNDNRFELRFFGPQFDTIFKDYCDGERINNVVLGGAFNYEKTADYLSQTDIINSYYNNFQRNKSLVYAMGIKESYSPLLYIPAIVDENTTWGKIGKKYGISFNIDEDSLSDLPNKLYLWYRSLKFSDFKQRCDNFNKVVDESSQKLTGLCDAFILPLLKEEK